MSKDRLSGNGGRGSGWERKKEGKARGVEATALVVTKARTLKERWGRGVSLVQWILLRPWEWPERDFQFHTDRPRLSEESTESLQKVIAWCAIIKRSETKLKLCENGFELQGISLCVTHMSKSMNVSQLFIITHMYISIYTHSATC